MNEPVKENPKTPKRSKRKPAMEPLGWDEIVSQPGMGGYLSFLNGPVPLPHLQGPSTVIAPDPGVESTPDALVGTSSVADPGANLDPRIDPMPVCPSASDDISPPGVKKDPDAVSENQISGAKPGAGPGVDSIPQAHLAPGLDKSPDSQSAADVASNTEITPSPALPDAPPTFSNPGVASSPVAQPNSLRNGQSDPGVFSIPAASTAPRLRVRKCAATHDGHSLGEEVLYQALWKAAKADGTRTRTIIIGWRGMSQLCRMTPKNCKINTQRLIRKLALEVLSPYNTPESIGTTYRVYSDEAILERRRQAGLEWVVRSRGVEFVNPATGASILPICADT